MQVSVPDEADPAATGIAGRRTILRVVLPSQLSSPSLLAWAAILGEGMRDLLLRSWA